MSTEDSFGLADAGEQEHRNVAGQRRLRAAYDLGHGRRLGGPTVIVAIAQAVDSQLQQIGDQWPTVTVTDLLMRVRNDLAGQIERIDALVAGLDGDDGPYEAA